MAGFRSSRLLATILVFWYLALSQVDARPSQKSGHETGSANAAPDGHHYLLGVGKADITGLVSPNLQSMQPNVFCSPITDISFMGYAGVEEYGTGLRQRLYSRAFIVGDRKNPRDRIVYLVLDLQSGDTAVRDGILLRLQGMGPEYSVYTKNNIAVTGTHSHSGPGGWANYFLHHITSLGFDRPTWEAVVNGSILSIKRAHESLKEGRISYGRIRLDDTNINRSPHAYNANPKSERDNYTDNVDKDLSMLRFADLDHNTMGVLTFFATHGTSLLSNNTLVTGDNKGVASYLFEKHMEKTNPGFVAGFSQANVGDVSPNIHGAFCEGGPDNGKPCKVEDSTCGGNVGPCHARGPYWGLNDAGTKSCLEIGRRQFAKAFELLQMMTISPSGSKDVPIRGPVKAFHIFKDLSFYEFPHPNGSTVQTCPSALGYSFAAGTTDGPGIADFKQGLNTSRPDVSVIWPILTGLLRTPSEKQRTCQSPKPILLDIGEINFPYAWGPNIVDIQLLRIGPVILVSNICWAFFPSVDNCVDNSTRRSNDDGWKALEKWSYRCSV
jgi:neutral ceramidase